jgi:thioredoxin-related protein
VGELLRIEGVAKIDNLLQDFYITLLHVTMSKHRQFKYMGLNTVSKQIKPGKNFMRSKYFCRILFVTLCLVIWFSSVADASDNIKWYSYKEGKVLGKIEKKKVFLHFYADWCGFCLKMAKDTFRDSAVVSYLDKNFIAVRVNSDKEADTAAKYGVMGLPSNWFLTEMGQPIGSIPGYIPPDAMLSLLKEVNGINEGD